MEEEFLYALNDRVAEGIRQSDDRVIADFLKRGYISDIEARAYVLCD